MKIETNASGHPILVLEQILLDNNEFRYVDRALGRQYTAIEVREMKCPFRIEYLGGRR